MIIVFQVSKPDFQSTRLFLACNTWGEQVRSKLVRLGFTVLPTYESPEPDTRDAEELARRDELLELTGL